MAIPGTVHVGTLNLRSGAGTEFAKLTTLSKNQELTAIGYSYDSAGDLWYIARLQVGGQSYEGYLFGNYVTLREPMPILPVEIPAAELPRTLTDAEYQYSGTISANAVNFRSGPATSYPSLGKLSAGQVIYIFGQTETNGSVWYHIMTEQNGAMKEGYVFGLYAALSADSGKGVWARMSGTEVLHASPAGAAAPVRRTDGTEVTLSAEQEIYIIGTQNAGDVRWMKAVVRCGEEICRGYVPADSVILTAVPEVVPFDPTATDKDFADSLRTEGFPESYIPYLTELHREHPNWQFHAFRTGLTWKEAIAGEDRVGLNLVHNDKAIRWLSFQNGAYNWANDTFVPYDSSYWVTVSNAGLQYYMDPRNWLTDEYVFMFEELSFDKNNQTKAGIESILKGTPMYKKEFSYKDANGQTKNILYSEAFLEAAAYSGVSPYHLASRVKQEVVVSSTAFSNSCNGKVAGFEGYYNFYNIGAYNSTASMGAVKNGLKFAKYGGTGAALNRSSMIPWDNRYSALVGGGYYIGYSYINRGQNTIYLQKYNVTGKSTYSHQYMANAEAPKSEAYKVYLAYKAMEDYDNMTISFSVPVYDDMPEYAVREPALVKNPNGYLKSLKVKDGEGREMSLSPAFSYQTLHYKLQLPESVKQINVSGTPVSGLAELTAGTGKVTLPDGNGTVAVTVTAQNGTTMTYTLQIERVK